MGRWTNSVDGQQRINLRVTFRLTVKDLAEALASNGVHGADAAQMSAAQVRKYIDEELYSNGMSERDNVDSFPVTQAHYGAVYRAYGYPEDEETAPSPPPMVEQTAPCTAPC